MLVAKCHNWNINENKIECVIILGINVAKMAISTNYVIRTLDVKATKMYFI